MREAVARVVHDGDMVVRAKSAFMRGRTIEDLTHLICFAAGREIIRLRRGDLTLCRLTPDLQGSLHPSVTLDRIHANLGWEVSAPPPPSRIATTEPPRPEELRILREELGPGHCYLDP